MTSAEPTTPEPVDAADASGASEEARADELFGRLPDPRARDELAALYQPLAEYLARRFYGRGEPLEDLIQVASIGLLKAIDRFDTERGVKFSTYATATVVGELKRHFRDKGWALRVPRRLQESGMKVGRAVTEMYQDLGRAPTVAEIGKRTGLSQEEVLEAMETAHAYTTASLDAPTDDEGAALPPRERRIIELRFFRDLTQTQIGEELGISQMHVSRLLSRTLETLRRVVGQTDG